MDLATGDEWEVVDNLCVGTTANSFHKYPSNKMRNKFLLDLVQSATNRSVTYKNPTVHATGVHKYRKYREDRFDRALMRRDQRINILTNFGRVNPRTGPVQPRVKAREAVIDFRHSDHERARYWTTNEWVYEKEYDKAFSKAYLDNHYQPSKIFKSPEVHSKTATSENAFVARKRREFRMENVRDRVDQLNIYAHAKSDGRNIALFSNKYGSGFGVPTQVANRMRATTQRKILAEIDERTHWVGK